MAFASYVFDGVDDMLQHTWDATAPDAERRTFTVSAWVKLNYAAGDVHVWQAITAADDVYLLIALDAEDYYYELLDSFAWWETVPLTDTWAHVVFAVDTTQSNQFNRLRYYLNGVEIGVDGGVAPPQNALTTLFASGNRIDIHAFSDVSEFFSGRLAFFEAVSGQALTPDSFAFDDGGTWTRKPYEGSYGNFGFSLDGSDGFNDVSGNGFHFTQSGGVQLDPNDLPPFLVGGGASIAPKMMHYRRLRI